GQNWIVEGGLQPGDRVIVQGVGKVQPGMTVKPVAAQLPPDQNAGKDPSSLPSAASDMNSGASGAAGASGASSAAPASGAAAGSAASATAASGA
ncbi:efflux transporter periplasmic adaptor subunit, partial [Burkholderia gladioli]